MIKHFYRQISPDLEYCFNVEAESELSVEEKNKLRWLLAETFEPQKLRKESFFGHDLARVVEIGPRLNFATAFSTNAVGICHACGLDTIKRIERSRRYLLEFKVDKQEFLQKNHDRMTEIEYKSALCSFDINNNPESVYEVPILEQGPIALSKINTDCGLGMDDWDIKFYHDLFANHIGRNPTNVECFQLGQANSEHSRHWFFKGKITLDGQEQDQSLFDIVKSTWQANPNNSVIAFEDNSSAIQGNKIQTILPKYPGISSPFNLAEQFYHIVLTAETHNFPCGVAPFPGAETGTGGRIRDMHATGQGSLVVAGTTGFCTGNFNLPDYEIGGEDRRFEYPINLASPLQIMIEESNGAYDYGNKFGEPCIQGFTRSFGLKLPNGERREWVKPIMFSGGIGQISNQHIAKQKPQAGMLVVQLGGPAYRIGVGGGSASSMIQGENKQELDFNAVQRGDAEMEQKMNRVIRACVEMMDKNPILSIHDQGAGGPCNVVTEIVDPAGGKIDIRKIQVGDQTMSVLEIWTAEYQERDALLIWGDRIRELQEICEREKVNCEVLGEITDDGRITVYDSQNDKPVVDMELEKILGKMPQKSFDFTREKKYLDPLKLPQDLSIEQAIEKTFRLPSVGSKSFLVSKVDRSVTGLIAQQQCCGPLQLPVANVAVIAQSHFSNSGASCSVGEQPIKMLINPRAGARMALGESLTNMVWALITDIKDIKSSLNWMWAAKQPGEGADLYDSAVALSDLMIKLGVAVDGGKDSLSMASKLGDQLIKAPGQMVVSAYAPVPDINKIITPDIKQPGKSKLMLIDLGGGKNRLGGSALAQVHGQLGDISPDVDDPDLLNNAFEAVQNMIKQDLILAGHDRSDGGLITTLSEMAMSGNCGLNIKIFRYKDSFAQLFSEELGLVIEYLDNLKIESRIRKILKNHQVPAMVLGTTQEQKQVVISKGDNIVCTLETEQLLEWWQTTSDRLEREQTSQKSVEEQIKAYKKLQKPGYELSFIPQKTCQEILQATIKPKVAIIREEGSNGDREMASAFYLAGFEPWDVCMHDLLNDKINLEQFNGMAFVGGFSYADVLDSAKGWAGIIKFNPDLRSKFNEFYNRPDTFSLGICNGCQLMALLGWVPWNGLDEARQPRFIDNLSARFESRWVNVKIMESPAIMFKDMVGSKLGVWVAHGQGRLYFPDKHLMADLHHQKLFPLAFVDGDGLSTDHYPFNPNGSPLGLTSLCSADGRHLAMMPHPERCFLKWQWPYMPEDWKENLQASPWLKMFQNAFEWVIK
ncbi:MAG: phosphoribosylformylglycinamidine synthase [bacterium]